jgi:phosphate/sulfate permease
MRIEARSARCLASRGGPLRAEFWRYFATAQLIAGLAAGVKCAILAYRDPWLEWWWIPTGFIFGFLLVSPIVAAVVAAVLAVRRSRQRRQQRQPDHPAT